MSVPVKAGNEVAGAVRVEIVVDELMKTAALLFFSNRKHL